MTIREELEAAANELPPSKKKFAIDYIRHMEGSWGDLWYDDEREWHYRVLRESVGERFAEVFKRDMDGRKSELQRQPIPVEFAKFGEMYHAESAYRDFHYAYERLLEGKPA